jgi:hypothetical protein
MLRKTVAALLLVLVASPFTAPFVTCDITSLFGSPTTVAPVQVQLARTVEEDAQAVAPGSTAMRRVRLGLKLLSEAVVEPGHRLPHGSSYTPLIPLALADLQRSSPSQRPLRI